MKKYGKLKISNIKKKQYGETIKYNIEGFGILTNIGTEVFDYDITYPTTGTAILNLVREKLGVTINVGTLPSVNFDNVTIEENLYGKTCYEVLQILATMINGYVTEDNNNVIIIKKEKTLLML